MDKKFFDSYERIARQRIGRFFVYLATGIGFVISGSLLATLGMSSLIQDEKLFFAIMASAFVIAGVVSIILGGLNLSAYMKETVSFKTACAKAEYDQLCSLTPATSDKPTAPAKPIESEGTKAKSTGKK